MNGDVDPAAAAASGDKTGSATDNKEQAGQSDGVEQATEVETEVGDQQAEVAAAHRKAAILRRLAGLDHVGICGGVGVVRALLASRAVDVNAQNADGESPALVASCS